MRGSVLIVVLVAACLASCIARPSRKERKLSKIEYLLKKRGEDNGDVKKEAEAEAKEESKPAGKGANDAKEEDKVIDEAIDAAVEAAESDLISLYRFEQQLLIGRCDVMEQVDKNMGSEPNKDHPLLKACADYRPEYSKYERLNGEQKKAADNELMKTGQYDVFDLVCTKLAISEKVLVAHGLTAEKSEAAKYLPRYRGLCKSWFANSDATEAENKTNEDKANKDAEGDKKKEKKPTEDKRAIRTWLY